MTFPTSIQRSLGHRSSEQEGEGVRSSFLASTDPNALSLLEKLMNIPFTACTLPRTSSGVINCRMAERMTALRLSNTSL